MTALKLKGDALIASALFIATLLFRGALLSRPDTFVFDEAFYANDAVDLAVRGSELTRVGHPPLGKWLIAIGYLTGRVSPVTWRLVPLVAGASVVAMVYVGAWYLTRSSAVGIAAAVLVATDGISHATGRYALLDGLAAFFTTAVLLVLLVSSRRKVTYGWAVGVGALCGAAVATKWTAAPIVVVAIAVCALRARSDGTLSRVAALSAALVGAAMLTYFASYTPWIVIGSDFGNCTNPACNDSPIARVARLPAIQREMLLINNDFTRANGNVGPGWRWVLQDRALLLFDERCAGADDGVCREDSSDRVLVTTQGNAVLWLTAVPIAGLWMLRRRVARPAGWAVPVCVAAAMWLPWLLRSDTYVIYAAPLVPALAISTVTALFVTLPRRLSQWSTAALVVAAVAAFAVTKTGLPWAA